MDVCIILCTFVHNSSNMFPPALVSRLAYQERGVVNRSYRISSKNLAPKRSCFAELLEAKFQHAICACIALPFVVYTPDDQLETITPTSATLCQIIRGFRRNTVLENGGCVQVMSSFIQHVYVPSLALRLARTPTSSWGLYLYAHTCDLNAPFLVNNFMLAGTVLGLLHISAFIDQISCSLISCV